jgi:type I restriction enzyme M protein
MAPRMAYLLRWWPTLQEMALAMSTYHEKTSAANHVLSLEEAGARWWLPLPLTTSPRYRHRTNRRRFSLVLPLTPVAPITPGRRSVIRKGEGYMYNWHPKPECQVSEIQAASSLETGDGKRTPRSAVSADPAELTELRQELYELHEQDYASRKQVDRSNDLTPQPCQLIFLPIHLKRHRFFRVGADQLFEQVLQPEHIKSHRADAVGDINRVVNQATLPKQYSATDGAGHKGSIYSQIDYIKSKQPAAYARVAEMLNRRQLTKPEDTNADDDVLGRAFGVMLHCDFECTEGMGAYHTPQQTPDVMVRMAFFDVLKEDSGRITRRDATTGLTSFHVCDRCCGSAGFPVTAMREVRSHVRKLLGLTPNPRAELIWNISSDVLVGDYKSPYMVTPDRINTSLHEDAQDQAIRAENSLSSDVFAALQYDRILTTPPFKRGRIMTAGDERRIDFLQSDVKDGERRMSRAGLALSAKPDSKGRCTPVNTIDRAALFIERCLLSLKPSGRLLVVIPEGILCDSGDRYVREYLEGKKDESTGRFVAAKAYTTAVDSLPTVTFRSSGSSAKTSFLYLQKRQPGDERETAFMAVADNVGSMQSRTKRFLRVKTTRSQSLAHVGHTRPTCRSNHAKATA